MGAFLLCVEVRVPQQQFSAWCGPLAVTPSPHLTTQIDLLPTLDSSAQGASVCDIQNLKDRRPPRGERCEATYGKNRTCVGGEQKTFSFLLHYLQDPLYLPYLYMTSPSSQLE